MPSVYIKNEDQVVIMTGTVINLHLSEASKAAIALFQPVAGPASYCLCSVVIAQASVTVSAVATNVGTATALASVTVPVLVAVKTSCPYYSSFSPSLQRQFHAQSIYRFIGISYEMLLIYRACYVGYQSMMHPVHVTTLSCNL
jgi:hypothetical protein